MCSGRSGCNWQSGNFCAKVVVFGEIGCYRAKCLYLGKVVVFGQKWLFSGKVFVFLQKWLFSNKVVDLPVAVGPQCPSKKSTLKLAFWSTFFGGQFFDKEMLITRKLLMAAKFCLQNRDRRLILHKICHFQPFQKFKLCKKFSWSPPFAEMLKLTDF